MKLRELLDYSPDFKRQVSIGTEVNILDKKALIIGLATVDEYWEEGKETLNKLFLLRDDELTDEEDDWEDEDEELEEEVTNRQSLMNMMDADEEAGAWDVGKFIINGKSFDVEGCEDSYLGDASYSDAAILRHFAAQSAIPDSWMSKELDTLVMAAYDVDESIYQINWKADILSVSTELEVPRYDVLVGKVIKCNLGKYDVPKVFSFKGRNGKEIEVKLHGVYLWDIWSDAACLEENFSELESYCSKDERLLVVKYETEDDLEMQFYTKDYLDAEVRYDNEDDACSFGVIGEDEHTRICVADVVPADFDDEVELELLSYCE